jgi:hypothetical protein
METAVTARGTSRPPRLPPFEPRSSSRISPRIRALLVQITLWQLSPHDVDGENAALMAGEQVIDKVANDRVRLVAELCHDPADERAAARVPFQVNRTVNIPGAVYFRPSMRASGLFRPDFNEAKFLFQERISHDFIA